MNETKKEVYFDNSSTSFPKAPGIGNAMADYLEYRGCNVGRGNYQWGYEVDDCVYKTRKNCVNFLDTTMATIHQRM